MSQAPDADGSDSTVTEYVEDGALVICDTRDPNAWVRAEMGDVILCGDDNRLDVPDL